MSQNLSHFDQELYSSKIDLLLKKITTRELGDSSKDIRRLRWKSRSQRIDKTAKLTSQSEHVDVGARDDYHETKTTDSQNKTIEYDVSIQKYQSLDNCKLISSYQQVVAEFSTLLVENVKKSVLYLNILPFKQGSLLIEKCEDSKIIIVTPQGSNIQLRLHELVNCRLYIKKQAEDEIQDVIIENCTNCIFHSSVKDLIKIHNFNHLDFQKKDTLDIYPYQEFDIEY